MTPKSDILIKDFSDVETVLDSIDWNFTSRGRFIYKGMCPFDCRSHHWFPATFIPEIPFTLIEILTYPNAVVCDPFAGIGTTYFQALLLNRKPLAIENCEVAVEFMKSLLVLFDPRRDLVEVKEKVERMIEQFDPRIDYSRRLRSDHTPDILVNELKKWFDPRTMNNLAYLFMKECGCNDPPTKAAMRIVISAILKNVSSQDRGWGCIADNMVPTEKQIRSTRSRNTDVLQVFMTKINTLLDDVQEHLRCVDSGYLQIYEEAFRKKSILHADARYCRCVQEDPVDLIVTSPPYPNMTDYVKSQRLSYYWLGAYVSTKKNEDLKSEIGARNKRHRKSSLEAYLEDLQSCHKILSKQLVNGGYVCLVMPVFGTRNRNDTDRRMIIQKAMADMERYFIKEKELERIVPTVRRTHNIKWATLERERIYIFRKEV